MYMYEIRGTFKNNHVALILLFWLRLAIIMKILLAFNTFWVLPLIVGVGRSIKPFMHMWLGIPGGRARVLLPLTYDENSLFLL